MKDKEASMIWRNWVNLGGSVTGTPAVAGWTTRATTVAVRDHGGHVRLGWRDENGWAPLWQLVDLPGSDAPSFARIGGSLYVFGRSPANNLLVGGAMATVNLGGDLRSSPVVAHWRLDGEAHVFARGADSAIWHLRWSPGATGEWHSIGGVTSGSPAAVAWGPSRLDVFIRGRTLRLEHCWWDGSAWSGWEDLGGVLDSFPCAISRDIGRLDVFYGDDVARLAVRSFDGIGWLPVQQIGPGPNSTPAAFTFGPQHAEVWDTSSGVVRRLYAEGAHASDSASSAPAGPTPFASAPSFTATAETTIHCVARSTGGQLHHIAYEDGYWSDWHDIGGEPADDPVAVSPFAGTLDVAVRTSNNYIRRRRLSAGTWTDWMSTDGATNDAMAVLAHQAESRLLVRGLDDHLYEGAILPDGSFRPWRDLGGIMRSRPHIATVPADALRLPAGMNGSEPSPAVLAGRYLCTLGTDGRTWTRRLGSADWEPWMPFGDGSARVARPLFVSWPLGFDVLREGQPIGQASQAGWIGRTTTGQTQVHAMWWEHRVHPMFVSYTRLARMPWTTIDIQNTGDPVGLMFLEPLDPGTPRDPLVVPTTWTFARRNTVLVSAGFQQLAPTPNGGWSGFAGGIASDPALITMWERFEDSNLLHVLAVTVDGALNARAGGFVAEPMRVRPRPSPPPVLEIVIP